MTNFFSDYLRQYRYFQTAIKGRDISCEDGIQTIWYAFTSCVEGPTELIGFIAGIAAIPVWCLAFIIMKSTNQNRKLASKRNELPQVVIHVLDCFGAALSFQLTSQVIFSGITLWLQVLLYCLPTRYQTYKTLEMNNHHSCKHKWRTRFYKLIGTILVLIISLILIIIVFIPPNLVTATTTTTTNNNLNTSHLNTNTALHINRHVYRTGMCLGALAAILILICNINTILLTKLKTSYSPSYLYLSMSADILYIFSVISQGWGFKVWLHSFPWILSRSLMVISYVLIVIQMGNNRWHPNEQTQQSEDMEALLSSLNSDKDVIVVPSDEAGNAGDHGIEDDVAAELEVGGTEVNTDVNVEDTVEEVMAHIQKDDDDDDVDEHISIQPLTTRRLLQLMKSSRNCQSAAIHSTASTETSYTPDQDVEPEVLSDSQQRELIKMALNQRRSSFQLHLSSLVTESRNERIAEWFKTSTPEDEGPFLLEEIRDFSNQV